MNESNEYNRLGGAVEDQGATSTDGSVLTRLTSAMNSPKRKLLVVAGSLLLLTAVLFCAALMSSSRGTVASGLSPGKDPGPRDPPVHNDDDGGSTQDEEAPQPGPASSKGQCSIRKAEDIEHFSDDFDSVDWGLEDDRLFWIEEGTVPLGLVYSTRNSVPGGSIWSTKNVRASMPHPYHSKVAFRFRSFGHRYSTIFNVDSQTGCFYFVAGDSPQLGEIGLLCTHDGFNYFRPGGQPGKAPGEFIHYWEFSNVTSWRTRSDSGDLSQPFMFGWTGNMTYAAHVVSLFTRRETGELYGLVREASNAVILVKMRGDCAAWKASYGLPTPWKSAEDETLGDFRTCNFEYVRVLADHLMYSETPCPPCTQFDTLSTLEYLPDGQLVLFTRGNPYTNVRWSVSIKVLDEERLFTPVPNPEGSADRSFFAKPIYWYVDGTLDLEERVNAYYGEAVPQYATAAHQYYFPNVFPCPFSAGELMCSLPLRWTSGQRENDIPLVVSDGGATEWTIASEEPLKTAVSWKDSCRCEKNCASLPRASGFWGSYMYFPTSGVQVFYNHTTGVPYVSVMTLVTENERRVAKDFKGEEVMCCSGGNSTLTYVSNQYLPHRWIGLEPSTPKDIGELILRIEDPSSIEKIILNAKVHSPEDGWLRAEVRSQDQSSIESMSLADFIEFRGNSIAAPLRWSKLLASQSRKSSKRNKSFFFWPDPSLFDQRDEHVYLYLQFRMTAVYSVSVKRRAKSPA